MKRSIQIGNPFNRCKCLIEFDPVLFIQYLQFSGAVILYISYLDAGIRICATFFSYGKKKKNTIRVSDMKRRRNLMRLRPTVVAENPLDSTIVITDDF